MRFLMLCAVIVLVLASPALGQTTQPSLDAWSRVVGDFAKALADSDPAALLRLLADDVAIQSFDSKIADAVRLLARTRKGTLIAAHAYAHPPQTVATDLAEAFKAADVPDDVKRHMTPPDETQARRANATAALWLADAVGAKAGDPVGVVVLFCDEAAGADPSVCKTVFVLIRGQRAAHTQPAIKTIAFGTK